MDFLNPAILAGVGLAAIPVVLHLIMRQQPRLLEFPALRFLQCAATSNRRQHATATLAAVGAARVGDLFSWLWRLHGPAFTLRA